MLGGAFVDRSLIDGEFDELFLQPIHRDAVRRRAAVRLLRSFDPHHVAELDALHRRMREPVALVWGEHDPFFPVAWAEEMVATFPDAHLTTIADARLFSHEERPDAVAAALRPTLAASPAPPGAPG